MMHPVVFNTSVILEKLGINKVVLSPGSRNAPLTISFARNEHLTVYPVVDERSAGFIALGLAQKSREPVALCCTSGTALLNYGPAVAEAFYSQTPLIILSADRPPEWQGQRDGQTIDQPGALTNFVKKTVQLPAEITSPEVARDYYHRLSEAINLASAEPKGPVHINIPFREPFYPAANQELVFDREIRVVQPIRYATKPALISLATEWKTFTKRLIVIGQQVPDPELDQLLAKLGQEAVVVTDVIANSELETAIRHHDLFMGTGEKRLFETLRPELLITCGRSVISKNLKLFLRSYPPKEHWHFDPTMIQADTFQSMTRLVQADLSDLIGQIKPEVADSFPAQVRTNFHQVWKVEDDKTRRRLHEALEATEFCEFKAFHQVMKALPAATDLHLANSMPVRYANFIQGLPRDTEVFCNRGTSGIDGTNGTAVGTSLLASRPTVLLTGDLSFLYDRNAFFHSFDLSSLKIVVFNNRGGGIFRLIKGPADLPELETYFETRHTHTAQYASQEFGFDYHKATDEKSLEKALKALFKDHKAPKLVEVFTDPAINQQHYQLIKNKVHGKI